MFDLSRRTFFAISAGGVSALNADPSSALLIQRSTTSIPSAHLELANALNLRVFSASKGTLGLAGLMSMRAANGEFGRYDDASLLLFPFKRGLANRDPPAFLAGSDTTRSIIAAVAMDAGGLAADEYFCHFVLKAAPESFIGFELGTPFPRSASRWPWRSNVEIGSNVVGMHWTSSNLNHPWFAGSRWIPDDEYGRVWRSRIIEGLRRAAKIMV